MTVKTEVKKDLLADIFGAYDENLKIIEHELGVKIRAVNSHLEISGAEDGCAAAKELLQLLTELTESGAAPDRQKVRQAIDLQREGRGHEILRLSKSAVAVTARGRQIKCKTVGQRDYVAAMEKCRLVFAEGPAGTGKTFLAVAAAVTEYKNNRVEKIILTRPAIEAGEKLGFLPGDMQMKVDPYLRPLYDALGEMLGQEQFMRLSERGVIEVAPLAYMRGRTLSNAFIILDEAQNATSEQMKMFLTRMGEGSRMVVTGDLSQSDLPSAKGLSEALNILSGVEGVAIARLTVKDVVRHELVQAIVEAYARAGK